MIAKILALIDLHTLFVLFLSGFLPLEYIIAGSLIFISKGLFFVLFFNDYISLFDVVFGLLLVLYIILQLPLIVAIMVFAYLFYKISISLTLL